MEALVGLMFFGSVWWMITWVACGIVCAIAAETRGRSSGAFFFLGIIFGPVGLLMLIAFGEGDDAPVEKYKMNASTERQCPACREIVRIDAIRCKYCTSQITPPRSPAAVEPSEHFVQPTIPVPRQVDPKATS